MEMTAATANSVSTRTSILAASNGVDLGYDVIQNAFNNNVWTFGNVNFLVDYTKSYFRHNEESSANYSTTDDLKPMINRREVSPAVQKVVYDFTEAPNEAHVLLMLCLVKKLEFVSWEVGVGKVNMITTHSLEGASRAVADKMIDEETFVCILSHDIGENLDLHFHGELAAELLRPFVTLGNYFPLLHHDVWGEYDKGFPDGIACH